jgi:hypothetical protein
MGVDQKRFGVSIKRGNFRKTQEDRVSLNTILKLTDLTAGHSRLKLKK